MASDYGENYGFNYIQLLRKSDSKEVYSSPISFRDNTTEYDVPKIRKNLNFYFERVNSGIQQQMESPKLTEEQKKQLKLLEKSDYLVREVKCLPAGYMFQPVHWTREASEFLK